jgi:uncharacterized protein (DUF1800 family)
MSMSVQGAIAANRFGLGAKPGEIEAASVNPRTWLKQQLQAIEFNDGLASSSELEIALAEYQRDRKRAKKMADVKNPSVQFGKSAQKMSMVVAKRAIDSNNSLSWRLLDFFSNHFSVSSSGRTMVALAPTLEREAIAPNLDQRFEQMLLSVVRHPAMLIYLNNERSFGPNSLAGKRGRGLNENLAREILELHTVGVNAGYGQGDVVELAKALSGWSVAKPIKEKATGFVFREQGHEPGTRTLLGKRYKQRAGPLGERQAEAMLRDLANHPATAQHLCFKLARHFVADEPSADLQAKLTDAWLKSQGNIRRVMEALIDADESWQTSPQKFKTPREFVISTARGVALPVFNGKKIWSGLATLGQQPFKSGSPAGYSDVGSDWRGASALMTRVEWSASIANQAKFLAPTMSEQAIMRQCLGDAVSERTAQSVLRAESREQALTLLLLSPEFLRR